MAISSTHTHTHTSMRKRSSSRSSSSASGELALRSSSEILPSPSVSSSRNFSAVGQTGSASIESKLSGANKAATQSKPVNAAVCLVLTMLYSSRICK